MEEPVIECKRLKVLQRVSRIGVRRYDTPGGVRIPGELESRPPAPLALAGFFSARLRFWTQIDWLFPASKLDQKKNLTISDTCGDGRAKDAAVAIGNWVFIFNQLTTAFMIV